MKNRNIIAVGAVGAVACIGACAAAAMLPALLAGGGIGLLGDRFAGWQVGIGVALIATAAVVLLLRRRVKQSSCACPHPDAREQP